MVDSKTLKVLNQYLLRLKDNGIYINNAFLFGSYAKGNFREDSDIDVLLVSDLFEDKKYELAPKVWMLATSLDYRIEPFMVSKKAYLNDEGSPLIATVKIEGVELLIN